MDRRVLSRDRGTGITKFFTYDENTGTCYVETEQDVSPVLAEAGEDYRSFDERARWNTRATRDAPVRVASIPLAAWQPLRDQGIVSQQGFTILDDRAFRRFLNDPDNRVFRTRPGRV